MSGELRGVSGLLPLAAIYSSYQGEYEGLRWVQRRTDHHVAILQITDTETWAGAVIMFEDGRIGVCDLDRLRVAEPLDHPIMQALYRAKAGAA